MKRYWRRSLIVTSLLLGLISGASFVLLLTTIRNDYDSRKQLTYTTALKAGHSAQSQIDDVLTHIMSMADELAAEVSAQPADLEEKENRLKAMLRNRLDMDPNILAVGIAFQPFAFDPKLRLYSVAYEVQKGGVTQIDVDALQDYTKGGSETDWYNIPIRRRTGVWLEPGLSPRGTMTRALYALPFFRDDAGQNPQGVLYFVYSSESLERLLNRLNLGNDGYSFILSSEGQFVFHPNQEWVDSGRTFVDILKSLKDTTGVALAKQAIEGVEVQGRAIDPLTQLDADVMYHPIASANWSLGIVFNEQVLTSSPEMLRCYITAGLLFVVAVTFLSLPLFRITQGNMARLWGWVLLVSLMCPLCMAYIVLVVRAVPVEAYEQITNKSSLRRFITNHNMQSLRQREKLPVYVPTGVYVQSATFTAANEVQLTGYIWQKYHPGIHDGLDRGFVFPESEKATIDEPTIIREPGLERYVWRFSVLVNQKFDYSRYPFSRENVWIQLWHKNFMEDVVLVPDLDSYLNTSPQSLCGLKKDLELPGWNINRSYFNYHMESYHTNFGAPDYSGLTNFPELYFNTIVTKQIIGPAIAHFLPISITYALLFTMLILTTRDSELKDLLGFNTMNVISACAAFFLVLIFLHLGLRDNLIEGGIVYVEYFYCITYAMILYVVVNSILFSCTELRLIHYRNNLIPKLLFWPISQFAGLILTVISFYPDR